MIPETEFEKWWAAFGNNLPVTRMFAEKAWYFCIDAQAQTIAELTKERDGYLHQLQNDEGYAELTAKLDAARGLARKMKASGKYIGSWADELLAILDAPTKPKEARNGEE